MTELFQRWSPRRIDPAEPSPGPASDVAPGQRDVRPWIPADLASAPPGQPQRSAGVTPTAASPQRQAEQQALESLREQAQRQGYEEGLRRGQQEAHALLAQQTQQLQSAMTALRNAAAQVDDSLEREIVSLSLGLAAQLLRREIDQHPETLHQQIQAACAQLPGVGGQLDIHMNPADVATLTQYVADSGDVPEGHWQFIEDPSITPGGFSLANDSSRVDERLETRLAAILRKAFAGSSFMAGGSVDG